MIKKRSSDSFKILLRRFFDNLGVTLLYFVTFPEISKNKEDMQDTL